MTTKIFHIANLAGWSTLLPRSCAEGEAVASALVPASIPAAVPPLGIRENLAPAAGQLPASLSHALCLQETEGIAASV